MTKVKMLDEEELKQVEASEIAMQEVSGIGLKSYDAPEADDLLSLINQANQANIQPQEETSKNIEEPVQMEQDIIKENDTPAIEETTISEEKGFVPRGSFDDEAFDNLLNEASAPVNEPITTPQASLDDVEKQFEAEKKAEEKRLLKEKELEAKKQALASTTTKSPEIYDNPNESSTTENKEEPKEFVVEDDTPIQTPKKQYTVDYSKLIKPIIIFALYNAASWALAFILYRFS